MSSSTQPTVRQFAIGALVILVVSYLLIAFQSNGVVAGKSTQINSTFEIYRDKALVGPLDESYFRKYQWTTPEGIEVSNSRIITEPVEVHWREGNSVVYSKGVNVNITANIRVADRVSSGNYKLLLSLPDLAILDGVLGKVIVTDAAKRELFKDGQLAVATLSVYGSNHERVWSQILRTFALALTLSVIGGLAFLFFRSKPNSRR